MLLYSGALKLLFFGEGKNVVAQNVLFAIVLVEAAGLCAIDNVVLDQNSSAALVSVDSPSTIAIRDGVVNEVVAQARAGRDPQAVYTAEVAQHSAAYVMYVVILYPIVNGLALAIAPPPSDGDSGVV